MCALSAAAAKDKQWSVWRSSEDDRGLSLLSKGSPPHCELSVNTINILKTAWVWCLREPPSSLLSYLLLQHKKKKGHYLLFLWKRYLDNNSAAYLTPPPPTPLLPAKFQWLMGAILWNFEMWGLEERGQGNTVDKKETGGVAAEALGTLEHVRAGKWFIEVMMINICLRAYMCILPNDLKRP